MKMGCPKLYLLNLSHNRLIMDRSLQHLAQHCTKLTMLRLCGCTGLTDRGIKCLAKATSHGGCHFLEQLDLSHCLCISKVACLADGCPFLVKLNLAHSAETLTTRHSCTSSSGCHCSTSTSWGVVPSGMRPLMPSPSPSHCGCSAWASIRPPTRRSGSYRGSVLTSSTTLPMMMK